MSVFHPSSYVLYGLDPTAVIAYRGARTLRLQLPLLQILSRFAGGRTFEDAIPELGMWFDDPEDARGFLEKMRVAELLVEEAPARSEGTPSLLEPCDGPIPELLVARAGLLLRAGPTGFLAHDPNRQRDVLLSEQAIVALQLFASPRGAAGLDAEELCWAAALFASRMLVPPPQQAERLVEPVRAKARRRPQLHDRERIPVYALSTHTNSSGTHAPLALGMILANARAHQGGVLLQHYELMPIRSQSEHLLEDLAENGPGIILFSDYIWCEREHREVSRRAKELSPTSVIVHGGPSVPKYDEAFAQYMHARTHVDVAIHGEGEVTVAEALLALRAPLMEMRRAFLRGDAPAAPDLAVLSSVAGLAFRTPAEAAGQAERAASEASGDGRAGFAGPGPAGFVRNTERERTEELDLYPSPYLTGEFDEDAADWFGAIIESNRGCPYGCTFCDWGSAILQKIKKFSLDRVLREIEWVASHQVRVLFIADANFGIFDRDVEIARHVAAMKQKYGYPLDIKMSYAKNSTPNLAEIVRIFRSADLASEGVISIQTTNPETLVAIRRSNIKTEKYDELAGIFRENQLPLATDLMFGLPGSTVASFRDDLQFYLDRDIPAMAFATVMLPNSPMADPAYRAEHRIVTRQMDGQEHVVGCATFTEADWEEMYLLNAAFHVLVNMGALRHVLFFLQWEYGVRAMELVHRLVRLRQSGERRLPYTEHALRSFRRNASAPGAWRWMYREIAELLMDEVGVRDDSALETVLRVQEAVMPEDALTYPRTVELPHDYAAYFEENMSRSSPQERALRPLADYPRGALAVTDPLDFARLDRRELNLWYFQSITLELRSTVSRRVASVRRMVRSADYMDGRFER